MRHEEHLVLLSTGLHSTKVDHHKRMLRDVYEWYSLTQGTPRIVFPSQRSCSNNFNGRRAHLAPSGKRSSVATTCGTKFRSMVS